MSPDSGRHQCKDMEHKEQTLRYQCLSESELSEADRLLVERAKQATLTSYSPYSHFSVGAAVLMANGEILSGSNQENASFTTGICAERTTVFYATAKYPGVGIAAIAIAAKKADGTFTDEPISPCGACRQVLAEIEHRFGKPYTVLLYGEKCIYRLDSMSALLPFQFNGDSM